MGDRYGGTGCCYYRTKTHCGSKCEGGRTCYMLKMDTGIRPDHDGSDGAHCTILIQMVILNAGEKLLIVLKHPHLQHQMASHIGSSFLCWLLRSRCSSALWCSSTMPLAGLEPGPRNLREKPKWTPSATICCVKHCPAQAANCAEASASPGNGCY